MRHISAILAAAAAGALALTCADPASAATGTVQLESPSGEVKRYINPESETCYPIGFNQISVVVNDTDRDIWVFMDADCKKALHRILSRTRAEHVNFASFMPTR